MLKNRQPAPPPPVEIDPDAAEFVKIKFDPNDPESRQFAGRYGKIVGETGALVAVEFAQPDQACHDCHGMSEPNHGRFFCVAALEDADNPTAPTRSERRRARARAVGRWTAHLVPLGISAYYLLASETAEDLYAVAVRLFCNLFGIVAN